LLPQAAHSQTAVYASFSDSVMTNLVTTQYVPGATVGLLVDGPLLFHHAQLATSIQGRFVESSTTKLNGGAAGPRFTFPLKHGFAPYAEFMVGFARLYSSGANTGFSGSTTDAELEINAGVARRIGPRLDIVADYSYAQYYALGGQYNPKTVSIGAIFHLSRR